LATDFLFEPRESHAVGGQNREIELAHHAEVLKVSHHAPPFLPGVIIKIDRRPRTTNGLRPGFGVVDRSLARIALQEF
jgi:hypothetical protein